MKIISFRTVRNKFMLPTVMLTLLLLSLLGTAMAMNSVFTIKDMLQSKADAAADFMSKVSVPSFMNFDYAALDNLVTEIIVDPEVDFAIFYDQEGRPLTKEIKNGKGSFIILERRILDKSGLPLGGLKIGFNRSAISANLRRSLMILFTSVAVSIFMFVMGMRMLTDRVIVRPIRHMEEVSEKMASGDLAASIKTEGQDEIASLGIAINRMALDLKEMLRKVRGLNEELERRVLERTSQLEAANRDLESFSYSVSHDLRAPLRAIDGFIHIICEEYSDRLDDEGRRLLSVVSDNANRMGQLINDILDFSRVGRKELDKSDVDMKALACEVWEDLGPLYAARDIHMDIGEMPHAFGDRSMLRQALSNLISNAAKFTKPREHASVNVGCARSDEGDVYYVRDNGVGFDMKHVGKLFVIFQRLHGPEEFEGTGIGLAIVKRIIDKHGGRVWAEGRPDEGAAFYFTLGGGGDA